MAHLMDVNCLNKHHCWFQRLWTCGWS